MAVFWRQRGVSKNRYQLSDHCQKTPEESRIIFGLVRAKKVNLSVDIFLKMLRVHGR
jgi:hypothetical protein